MERPATPEPFRALSITLPPPQVAVMTPPLRATATATVNATVNATVAFTTAAGSLAAAVAAPLILSTWAVPVQAGPVVCTTTLEAPPAAAAGSAAATPVEFTRCGTVLTVPQLMEQRFFSYTAPFARGVSLTNQITDLFGIAMGGVEGNRVMGLGFTDQTIIWDASAVTNTTRFLMEQQSDPMPIRTGDVSSGFSGSLGGAGTQLPVEPMSQGTPQSFSLPASDSGWSTPVRGLW